MNHPTHRGGEIEAAVPIPSEAARLLTTYGFRAVSADVVLGRVYVVVAGPAPASTDLLMRQLDAAMSADGLQLGDHRALAIAGALVLTLEATPYAVALDLREVA